MTKRKKDLLEGIMWLTMILGLVWVFIAVAIDANVKERGWEIVGLFLFLAGALGLVGFILCKDAIVEHKKNRNEKR